ncbi:MAG: hypothetical protein JKY26_13815 [Pseudomonas sp.]|nr:hypothetical protein [Pseudomonas sp.]
MKLIANRTNDIDLRDMLPLLASEVQVDGVLGCWRRLPMAAAAQTLHRTC